MSDRDPLSDSMGLPVGPLEPEKKVPFVAYLRRRFVTGVLVALPLVVTLFFARFIFNLLDRWSYPISEGLFGRPIPGAGAVLALILVFILGVLAHNVLGRRILHGGESVIARVPVLSSIYVGTREVTRAFSTDRTHSFRRVVLIPYPVEGAWCLAFVTREFKVVEPDGARSMVSVFMPSTPNPTTGFYLIYPTAMIRETDLSIEEAARLVISGGILAPDLRRIMKPPIETSQPS